MSDCWATLGTRIWFEAVEKAGKVLEILLTEDGNEFIDENDDVTDPDARAVLENRLLIESDELNDVGVAVKFRDSLIDVVGLETVSDDDLVNGVDDGSVGVLNESRMENEPVIVFPDADRFLVSVIDPNGPFRVIVEFLENGVTDEFSGVLRVSRKLFELVKEFDVREAELVLEIDPNGPFAEKDDDRLNGTLPIIPKWLNGCRKRGNRGKPSACGTHSSSTSKAASAAYTVSFR